MKSLQNKLLISFLPLVAVGILLPSISGMYFMFRQEHKALRTQLIDFEHSVELEMDGLVEEAWLSAQVVTTDKIFLRAVKEQNRKDILNSILQFRNILRADTVKLLAQDGTVIAQAHQPSRYGQNESYRNLFLKALSGQVQKGVERSDLGLGIDVFLPIKEKKEIVAILGVSRLFGLNFLTKIKKKYGLEVMLHDGDRLQATTFTNSKIITAPALKSLFQEVKEAEESLTRELKLDNVMYFVTCKPIRARNGQLLGTILLALSHEKIHAQLYRSGLMVASLALAILVVTTLICMRFSRQIVLPLQKLSKVTKLIAEGDLSRKVDVCTDDEVGELAQSFNEMSEALQGSNTTINMLHDALAANEEAQAALQESEQRFRAIFDTHFQLTGLMDPDGILLSANRAALEYHDSSAEDVFGKPFWETGWWTHDEELKQQLKESIKKAATGKFVRFEATHVGQDGKLHYIDFSIKPARDEHGQIIFLVPEGRDITEHKLNELKYQSLFEAAGDAIFIMHNDRFQFCNSKSLEIYGCSKEQLIGHSPQDFSPSVQPDGRDSIEAAQEKINGALAGTPQIFEWQHQRGDGSLFDAEVSLTVFELAGEKYVHAIVRDITERKKAEVALKESERNYREIFNATSDAIFIHDAKTGNILDVNQVMLDMYGYERDEINDILISDLSADSTALSQEKALKMMQRAQTEGVQIFEWQSCRKNGDTFWVEVALRSTEIGGQGRVLAVVRDISQRKKAEEELRHKEQQQSLLLRSLPMAFYVAQPFDTYGGTWVSEQIINISGFTAQQFADDISLWVSRLHPEDKERVLAEFDKITDSDSISLEYRWQNADGSYRWLQDEGVLIRNDKGEPAEIMGTWLDITERKKEQEALLFTQHSVDTSPIPIVWFVDKAIIVYANEAASKLTGFSNEELMSGEPAFLGPNKSPEDWEIYFPVLRQDKILSTEINLRKKDNATIPVWVTASYLKYEGTEYALCLFEDLQERKKLEEKLRQAQKMEAIGTLAGGIAHDFNNILSAIFGYTELAKMSLNNPEKLQRDLDEVTKGATRAKDLVKQILTFSRRTEQEKQALQVSLVVKEALKLLRSSIPSTIQIKQKISSNATVLADPTQIHQVVMNLCTNAYHAMREEGGTLAVGLKEIIIDHEDSSYGLEMPPGKYLQLEVSDTGIGIDKDTLGKIFEPYFTTKEKGEGTGLGLALVHGIIQGHKGFVNVYSEVGHGTTFHAYLPVTTEEGQGSTDKDNNDVITGGTEHIMFVDDEESLLELAHEILGKYGYKVSTFKGGELALDEFKKNPDKYDLVITDMTMPKIDGAKLSKKIFSLRPDMPIILCTGHSETINRKKALDMGICEYCEKPVVMSKMIKTIRKVLDQGKQP